MDSAKDILVIAETAKGAAIPLVFELLGLARRVASETGASVSAAVQGCSDSNIPATLISHGADRVVVLPEAEGAEYYQSDVWLAGLGEAFAETLPHAILIGHTALGADLAPRLAFRLKAAVATGCEQVTISNSSLVVTRPCFGNKAREVLSLKTTPSIATVRAKMYEPLEPDAQRHGEVVTLPASAHAERTPLSKVLERKLEDAAGAARLESARVIVAGGRGLGGPEGFRVLEEMASALGGAVGASRVACDLGWCPHSWQIGLTGKTVIPELYIAVGISGASHHMAGCGNAKTILAINSDPDAAIFGQARFGIVGDYKEIVPALIAEIAKRLRQFDPHAVAGHASELRSLHATDDK